MTTKSLTALPVFNERAHVGKVLDETLRYSRHVLVVDDGSTDGTSEVLAARKDIRVVTHGENRGYGAALKSAFDYAIGHGYGVLVTIDCDGQHEPKRIPELVAATGRADIVSGSRYLAQFAGDSRPPEQRRRVNRIITEEINRRLGLHLTDAFCGFKAYRVDALRRIEVTDPGYAMPLELWVQAAFHRLRILEVAVPLIYLDEARSFGGSLDDTSTRLAVYREVLERAIRRCLVADGRCTSAAARGACGTVAGLHVSKFSTAGSACGETL
ncbi:MAG: glycosyltransferase family 2 protein [Pirellulales bacterium]|jgi:dolichol-phosphate mannosyltransferase|nr:glycosyltransferase family 2 protein [Thermoguttaceae bacterium]MDD4788541.1 glycosyltransferase family 2 protein [Pirellulales bacterium]MDI9446577.1 glycosyltransferase family 2 protein [Planctomycetota bacterium]NLZ01944.1 glycosyltransferase family 2 protein [Pirellulaceae bacterium]